MQEINVEQITDMVSKYVVYALIFGIAVILLEKLLSGLFGKKKRRR